MSIRVILLVIGVLIVLGIILDGVWRRKRNEVVRRNINRRDESRYDNAEPEVETNQQPELKPEPAAKPQPEVKQAEVQSFQAPEPQNNQQETVQHVIEDDLLNEEAVMVEPLDDFIVLTVMAQPGENFEGFDLLQALLKVGLVHGDMNIFHRHRDLDNKSPTYFSVASVTAPGYFDIQNMNVCTTRGLNLFMSVPDVDDPSDVFEIMLAAAVQLAEKLDGLVCDRQRELLTEQGLAVCRSRAKITGSIQS